MHKTFFQMVFRKSERPVGGVCFGEVDVGKME